MSGMPGPSSRKQDGLGAALLGAHCGAAELLSRRMPRSALSAVRTPGRVRPSSTRVIATAGCMPTSTVCVSMMRDTPEMVPIMRPMKESTMSSAEMSISTPLAEVALMRSDRSSCRVMASWSCMSTWMVTSRNSPICRIGMRSMASARLGDGQAQAMQGQLQGVGQVGLGHHALQVQAQVHDGLGDLRAYTADDAVGAHQADGGHGLEQVLGHQGIDGGHTGDVDDGDFRAGVDDALQQRFHHHLGALRVQGADHRQCQYAVPQLDHRGGQLQQFFLLALDHRLAGFLEGADGVQAQGIEQFGHLQQLVGQLRRLLAVLALQQGEQRALEGEDEGGSLLRV
uniref:PE-PGRS family protein n=1 Tax=Steinernema glaseri TaxID=37863 RepID=A0A1I7YBM1_9BILA